jgi:hypothetical protein
VAASAADLNVAGVRQYTTSEEQVTSITQFSDVKPTDWAYQALSNLIERYGCVAGYPNGTYKGGQAMTRWEAAALLNACLDRITEVTDELKRLLKEFEKELAVLKGRVDSLEAKVGELEATQFSTTTKLKGIATFVLGANSFSGSNALVTSNQANYGATTFNYDLRLNFDTSFTGKDLLRTTLRAGNFSGINGPAYGTGLSALETAFEQPQGDNAIGVNRLFYNFPVGSELSLAAGPMVRVDDAGMLGMWPSVYPADTVLDFFTYAGAPGAYNLLGLGAGAGFVWSPKGIKGLTISQNYVSANGQAYASNTTVTGNAGSGNPGEGGVFTNGAGSAAVTQVAYAGDKTPLIGGSYGLAFAYTYSQNLVLPIATPAASAASEGDTNTYSSANSLALSGYWKPEKAALIPSVSWGLGSGSYNLGLNRQSNSTTAQTKGTVLSSWYTGLQWDDAFIKGNALGMAVGQAPYVAKNGQPGGGTPNDSNYMWEWWYKFQVTDNISITPAIYYISNYDGANGATSATGAKTTDNLFGGLLKTTFKF